MCAVLQRVQWAALEVDDKAVARIDQGLLVYVGVGPGDAQQDADRLADKVANLRVFQDDQGKMNRSVQDVRGGVLAVPNFTLYADARKGRRERHGDRYSLSIGLRPPISSNRSCLRRPRITGTDNYRIR